MSRSPYLSNPNILAHPDRIVQTVALDMTAQESYLAGSPISAEGKLANDATAIGILLYDVHKSIGGRDGTVVISGRIKQDVAAEWSGVAISAEAKSALVDITFTGDGGRMGGGSWNDLTDKPFGEEEAVLADAVLEDNGSGTGFCQMASLGLSVGQTYTVELSDGVHNSVCKETTLEGTPVAYLGNIGIIGGEDTGESYVVYDIPIAATTVVQDTNGGNKVIIKGAVINPLDPKFLPEGYPYEESGLVEVLPEEPIDISGIFAYPSKDITLEEGKTYRIVFDGVEYSTVCKPGTYSGMSIFYIGNGGIGGVGENTGEPVAVGVLAGSGTTVVFASESGSHTIGVAAESAVIHPIDPKFLPNPSDLSADWITAMKTALGI